MMRWLGLVLAVGLLAGCGNRSMRIEFVPVENRLLAQVVETDEGPLLPQVALLNVSGMIANSRARSVLSTGSNPVSDLREALKAVERDEKVKAVVLRINSPGGTVTASDMMYREVKGFKSRSGKPVVVSMMDVCASGGYYLSCAGDYRYAYPTTITGSIGVIVQTMSLAGTLDKLGISTKALTSGPNKDMGSPLRPLTRNDEELIGHFVKQFYGNFLEVVKSSRQRVKEENWARATDGRVISGKDAVELGLVDELGDLDAAIGKAKALAGIKKAAVIMYRRSDDGSGSVYAEGQRVAPQVNLLNVNVEEVLWGNGEPRFMYLWQGQ